MRSYYAHLENAMNVPSASSISPKPVYRSSAIFPALNREGLTTRIIFMGYWILKRHIHEIACVINLRSEEGILLNRTLFTIQEAKTFRIELQEQLAKAGIDPNSPFTGSIECEFFSTSNLVFPFPALAVNYYGDHFSSVVHTAQRVYNDFDDLRNNSQTQVPESGFNIYADIDHEPFFALINGAEEVPDAFIEMEFYNRNNDVLTHELKLGTLKPYQTCFIYPAREVPLQDFLQGAPGAAKIRFKLNWVFPRLVVGNIQRSLPAMTITHSYYDCSAAQSPTDYWKPSEAGWYPASLMIPVTVDEKHFTNVYFYPIYSPSDFNIDVEIYDSNGKQLGKKRNFLKVHSPNAGYHKIPINVLCKELGIQTRGEIAARIIAQAEEGKRIPARIKLGLDLGVKDSQMPCNICTNLQPFNPSLETKPTSFRWAPILADQENSTVWLMNSSPIIEYGKTADIEMTFFHESGAETINRKISIPPNGFHVIHLSEDQELAAFFEGKVGWFTAITTNPYTTTYYFSENASGVVGGDHGF